MSRFMKYATVAGKQVPIYVAQEVKHAGYKRAIDAIDANILSATVENVKAAVEGHKMLSDSQKAVAKFITITYINHVNQWNLKVTR